VVINTNSNNTIVDEPEGGHEKLCTKVIEVGVPKTKTPTTFLSLRRMTG
jgi:hypothetical protein